MSQIRSCSSPTASYPVSFAFVDWFLTCLSSVTRAFCLSFFWEVLGSGNARQQSVLL
uniref:Uncharacterized protein n=1 Tax=Rhizophagus irregularis (strain DAOM 181602 / DAOM 197198 / MUCL 43194) TaxID=747089 RepID=U9SS26_RHIID